MHLHTCLSSPRAGHWGQGGVVRVHMAKPSPGSHPWSVARVSSNHIGLKRAGQRKQPPPLEAFFTTDLTLSPYAIVAAYRDRPAILHFAGHGDDRSLSLILDQGLVASQTPVIAEQLATILGAFPNRIRLCVLNTCASASVAQHIVDAHVVDAAVGWPTQLADATAIAFSGALYRCLGDGLALSQSVTLAAQSCSLEEMPMLYTDESVDRDMSFV